MIKVCVMCKSVLLETALKKLLKRQVTTFNECDVVLTDRSIDIDKPSLFVSSAENSDIKKPFTHSSLILQLEKFNSAYGYKINYTIPKELETKIDNAIINFSKNLTQIIKSHYENQ